MNFAERIKIVLVIREARVLEHIPLRVAEPRQVINKVKGKRGMEKQGKQEGVLSL